MPEPAFDLQQLVNEAQSSPVFWILGGVIGFSIAATFVWPVIKKVYSLLAKLVTRLKANQEAPVEIKKENKLLKKQFIQVTGVVIALVALGLGGWFYFQSKPETISARNFVKREARNIDYIEQHDTYTVYLNSDLYLIDLRTKEHFKDRHISGSFNVQLQRIRQVPNLMDDRKIALYSSLGDIETTKEAANIIKRGTGTKIYIIEDGYEGLKNQGLETRTGPSFGIDYFEWQ